MKIIAAALIAALTFAGCSDDAVLKEPPRGIVRIVPAGRALDFSHIWDGHDLIAEMSRQVCIF